MRSVEAFSQSFTNHSAGPLAAAFGPAAIFGVGAVYGLLSSAVMLTLPSVRRVTWVASEQDKP